MSASLERMFNREYFDRLSDNDYEAIIGEDQHAKDDLSAKVTGYVDTLINMSVDIPPVPEDEALGNVHFQATTTYPGLLVGIGNVHELPGVTGQAILGFEFDYTSGLPMIPGSSIKGILRSAFDTPEYIRELLREIGIADAEAINISELEEEIFGQTNGSDGTKQGNDVFFDAYVVEATGKLLGDDYITPHGNDPTQEPTPLRFIKVMPGVIFQFDFDLSDSEMIQSNMKALMFSKILSDLGIGAKTNVGYGKLLIDYDGGIDPFDTLLEQLKSGDLSEAAGMIDACDKALSAEQKEVLYTLFNDRLLFENQDLDRNWHNGSIERWLEDDSLSNGARRRMIGHQFFNIFRSVHNK